MKISSFLRLARKPGSRRFSALPELIVTVTLLAYVLVFTVYHEYAAVGISSLLIIPVLAGAWYFGVSGGIAVAVLCILATATVQILTGRMQVVFTAVTYLRILTTLLVAFISGRFGVIAREHQAGMQRLEELSDMTRTILESRDLETTLKSLVERFAYMFQADDAYFAFWDEEHRITTPMVAYGSMSSSYPTLQYQPGERTLTAAVMDLGYPLVIPDLKSSSYFSPNVASLFPSRSMLGVPLILQGKKLAAFCLGYNRQRRFEPAEIVYAESAAQQIALVLMKTQLLADAQKQVRQLALLHELSTVTAQAETVDHLLERTTEIIGRNLFSDNFGILLLDEEREVLRVHPSYHFMADAERLPVEVPLTQGVIGQAAWSGESVRVGDIHTCPNYREVDPETLSQLCVPIRQKDRVLGVINAESRATHAFSLDDEMLLQTLANQLATAIEEQRAKAAERRWLDQLSHSNGLIGALAHISTDMERALRQEDIIRTLGEKLDQIGITCTMAVHDTSRETFRITYTSLPATALEQLEVAIGSPLVGSTFSLGKLRSVIPAEEQLRTAVIPSPEEQIRRLFSGPRKMPDPETMPVWRSDPNSMLFRLPLVFEESLQGILWLWSSTLTDADLPVLSIFGKQVASALERARLFQEVQSLAIADPLTGLSNRRHLFELGKVEFARSLRTKRPFGCMILDIDHFKHINDQYGHLMGDLVLQEFAQRARRSIREVDFVGRYGGEEFVVFLPETDTETTLHVAERLRESLEREPIQMRGKELHVTVSIGVSRKDEHTPDLETLVARADQALYIAKYKGRNQVVLSGDAMRVRV